MTRDDIPTGAADPDAADEPSLVAARASWRALREPLAPDPDVDARIRAAARRAAGGTRAAAVSPAKGGPAAGGLLAGRLPAPSGGHARRYAGWGLAIAAALVGGIVLVLPPAPLADLPLETRPAAVPASPSTTGDAATRAPASAVPPAHVGRVDVPLAGVPPRESQRAASADVAAEATVEPARTAPVTSTAPALVTQAPAGPRAEATAAPTAPVEAFPAPAVSSARAAPPALSSTALSTVGAADAARAGLDDALAIERELAELRALLRARDPTLHARLRTFVAQHPGHPLAQTDPALAGELAPDRDRQ